MSFTESNPQRFVKLRQQLSGSTRMKTRSTALTKEEREILILATLHPDDKHLSDREIGRRLGISVSRVKTLLHQACVKLGAHNRNEAIWIALRRGEIDVNKVVSLEDLAEMLSSVGPDVLRRIAHLMRQELEQGHSPEMDEQIIRMERRQDGILTNRERDVLVLAAHGLTNKEIADRLCISVSAVGVFLKRASAKLGAHKRTDAVMLALKQGEISIGEIQSLDEFLRFLVLLGPESVEKMAQLLDEKLGKEPASSGSHYNYRFSAIFRNKSYPTHSATR